MMKNNEKYDYQSVSFPSEIVVEAQDSVAPHGRHTSSRRAWSALLLIPLILLVALILSSDRDKKNGDVDPQIAASTVNMLGKSHKKSSAKQRLLDDCTHIDVSVPCEEAYFHPLFYNYIDFQHTVGVDVISPVGEKTFELYVAGMNVTLYVNQNDETLTEDVELVDGFDFFSAYHETWEFVSLPTHKACRSVGGDKRGDLKQGCRVFHSFSAIFGEKAPVTEEEWLENAYEEALAIREFVEA